MQAKTKHKTVFWGGGVDYDIEHCDFFSYFLPNLLNIGKKYLKTAKNIDESLILQLFCVHVTILLSQVIS
jgi:hypothetical protein